MNPEISAPLQTTFDIAGPLPSKTLLLEASAGTGKTWTIAALVTRWVAEGKVTLPEMLVVTFGRAASAELRSRVREQLVMAERALRIPPPETHRDALLTTLLAGPPHEIAARAQRLRTAISDFDSATIATIHQFCQMVLRSLGVAGDTDAEAQLVEDLDDLLSEVVDDLYLRGFGQSDDPPTFTYADAMSMARAATNNDRATISPADSEPATTAYRRVRFVAAVRREFEARKRQQGLLHYNDLLSQLSDALEDPTSLARTRMQERWKVVLVDEFQDTDPVQWDVFRRAFTAKATMVLIGDPKQAIYGFRGGDVDTYIGAAQTADSAMTLGINYRSDAPLVESLSAFLSGTALGDPDIVVPEVAAHHQGSRLAGAPVAAPMRLRVVTRAHLGVKNERANPRIDKVRDHIDTDAALDIARLLAAGATHNGRPLQPKDVAVLAHTGKDLERMRSALARLGVPAVLANGGRVFDTLAAREWLAVLRGLLSPSQPLRARAAAVTNLMGFDIASLDERINADSDQLDDALSRELRQLADLVMERGVAALMEHSLINGLSSRVLSQPGGERTMTDLRQVGELLHQAGRSQGLSIVALTEWLTTRMADSSAPTGTKVRRLESDDAAVQLATIHSSKGLQWPVVYLPFVSDRYVFSNPPLPNYHSQDEHRERRLEVGGPQSPTMGQARQAHLREEAGESLRLLYVALTRAESQVIAWWAPSKNAAASALHRILAGRGPGEADVPDTVPVPTDAVMRQKLNQWATTDVRPGLALESADLASPPKAVVRSSSGTPRVRQFSRRVDTTWRRTSYSALTQPNANHPSGVSSEPELQTHTDDDAEPGETRMDPTPVIADLPSPMADLPVGATFGSLVHSVLEETNPMDGDLSTSLTQEIGTQLLRWPVNLGEDGVALLATALQEVYRTPLGPLASGHTLGTIPAKDRLAELDFELPLAGGDSPTDEHTHVTLGDLRRLLDQHLPDDDPVRAWGNSLADPALGSQALRGYLTGSIDAVLRVGDRYLVVDYKTNWLGQIDEPLTAAAYGPAALHAAMGHSSYPLQALLYAVVAHRFLRGRVAGYDPDRHLGGVLYLYLRGMSGANTPVIQGNPCGVFSWQPPVALVTSVSDLLDGARQ